MNYTRGPWSIQIKPKAIGGGAGNLKYLSIDNDTGPVVIVDMNDRLIAAVVHRPGRAEGFSETASNARVIGHAPELLEKSRALVKCLRERWGGFPAPDCQDALEELEKLLDAIEGKPVVSSSE
jgi:hypothetical protein